MAPLRGTILATLAAVGLLCALLFPGALFRGEVLSQADVLLEHEPWRAVAPPGFVAGNAELSDQAAQFQPWNLLLRERLAGGALPLWNPRAGAGEPLLANLQSAVLSPFTALSLLFPFGAGLLVAALAQLLCAGLGTALFARRLRCSLPACVFAALAFTFGGFQFLWLQHPHAAVSCLLPWLLLLADLWIEAAAGPRGTPRSAEHARTRAWLRPAFALGVAALILCGHIETALHVALAVAAWTLLASGGRPLAARARLVADMGVWSLVGAALAGLQLLPFVEYLQLSESYAKRSGFQDLWRRVPWEQWPLMTGAAALLVALVITWRRSAAALGDAGLAALRDEAGTRDESEERGSRDARVDDATARTAPTHAGTAHAGTAARGASANWRATTASGRIAAASERAAVEGQASSRRLRNGVRGFVLAVALGALLLALLDAAGFSRFHRLLFHPDAYGNPLPDRGLPFDGPRAYVNINNGYAGLVTLFLAFYAVTCGARLARPADDAPGQRGVRALAWLWLLAFLLAYELPIASQLVNRLPLLNLALNYRFTLIVGFCSALLGAVGLDALCRPALRSRPAPVFWLLGGVLVGALTLAPDARGALDLFSVADAAPVASDAAGADAAPRASGATATRPAKTMPVEPRWLALGGAAVLLMLWGTWPSAARRDLASVSGAAGSRLAGLAAGGVGADRRGAWLAAAALVLLGTDLFLFGRGMHPSAPAAHVFPATPVTDFLAHQPGGGRLWAVRRDVLMPNTAGVYGLSDLRSYDALGVERMAWLREALRPASGEGLEVGSGLCAALDLRFVLAPGDWSPPPDAAFTRVFASSDCAVWRNERATGRAFVAHSASSIDAYLNAEPSAAGSAAFAELPAAAARRQRTLEIAHAIGAAYRVSSVADRELLIEGDDAPLADPSAPKAGAASPDAGGSAHGGGADSGRADSSAAPGGGAAASAAGADSAVFRVDEPERQELDVHATAPGWLCVADTFYPGWTARVNGAAAPIVPAFLALRAVRVPAGDSRVEFRYEPESVRDGAWLSAGGALLVLIGAAAAVRAARWSGPRGVGKSDAAAAAARGGAAPAPPGGRTDAVSGGHAAGEDA